MSSKRNVSSLLSPQAMGGDTAEGGFQYQANLITARVPDWLSYDGFTEMIRESLGDTEAKFFIPGKGLSREFIEYKNHHVTPSEFWEEVCHFSEMDSQSPETYHRFVLACTGVSEELKTVINALRRVRDASPFYEGSRSIIGESFADFVGVIQNQGKCEEMAKFLFDKVWFEVDLTDAEAHPKELFREALYRNFPCFEDAPGKESTEAYQRIVELIKLRKNRPITRKELEAAVWGTAKPSLRPPSSLRVHTVHTNPCYEGDKGCLRYHWAELFGGPDRSYPSSERWNEVVIRQLEETKVWILSNDRPRTVRLGGNRRLSASFAIGSVFSAVSGFVIEMERSGDIWKTTHHPTLETPNYSWMESFSLGQNMPTRELALGIGIMRDVASEFNSFLDSTGFSGARLCLFGESPVSSAEHANKAVAEAKKIVSRHVAHMAVEIIHFFPAVPAQFALFLGHRMNATCKVLCYERTAVNTYLPSCLVCCK